MKKISLFLSIIMCLALCSCQSKDAASAVPKDYAGIISTVQSEDEAKSFEIVSDAQSELGTQILSMLNIEPADIDSFAVACSFMNVNAYCVGIFKPTDKSDDIIKTALAEYIDLQKKSMENYLPEQYDIAKSAIIKQVKSGEIIIVMCQNQDKAAAAIEKALK